ncbi:hypothetical protein SSX86_005615 [Deinandra increscens subsp. villosa]|uniref:HTH myb-type domain-containing protein n=1 Tax=Deinandra increscens subsp. villosa TaxID=3103831 RepID=A0AAP0H717_9ASTR
MGKLISPPELTFDFKPTFIPKTITQFLGDMARIGSESEKIFKPDDLVSRLEAEVKKIDVFKRELPLCMLLMNHAIAALKEEITVFKKSANQPVLEEFIPLKKTCDGDRKVETDSGDKKNWLSSTQLWNTDENQIPKQNSVEEAIHKISTKQQNGMLDDPYHLDSGKEFIPFKGYYGFSVEDKEETPVSGLSLINPGFKNPVRGNSFLKKIGADNNLVPYSIPDVRSDIQIATPQPQPPQLQTSRKQRRCWSTELHRRFLNALQQLGGSKVATPKQIRELMRVDGLTNDEVKSHLQKYRLHTKRLSSDSSDAALRGLWAEPHDHYAIKHVNSQSGSPDGPLLNGTLTSTTGGGSMDDGEDEKSETNCWRSHPYTSGKADV